MNPNLIDDIISELSKSDKNLAIFCGAGISINSGIPSAIPLLSTIFDKLKIEPEDKLKLISSDNILSMPFEAFFEVFIENSSEHQLLNIFNEGEPNTNHFFLWKCYSKGIMEDTYTTNFDLLIEKAFRANGVEIKSFSDEESFKTIDNLKDICKLIKIHGSIDNVDSIRTTLSTIANRKLSAERDKIIERIFGCKDEHKRILIIGYSCSDIFDIIPKIEKIFLPAAKIYLLEYTYEIQKKEDVIIEDISNKKGNNPFAKYAGKRIKVNTDLFIKWFWDSIDTDYIPVPRKETQWLLYINEWLDAFKEEYTKASIVGQIFYQISDFENALKYHQKAFQLSEGVTQRGQGASLSNMGLIYHDMKQYPSALEYHKKANDIFIDIGFFFGIAASYTNMGYAYIYVPDKIKAILNLKKSLRVSRKNIFRESRRCESDALCNLGLLYEKNGEYQNALYYYFETLEIDKLGNKLGESHSLSDIGRVYLLLKDYKKSTLYFKRALEIAIKLGAISVIKYSELQLEKLKTAI